MKSKLPLFVVLALLMVSCTKRKSVEEDGMVKFYVAPATNSDDPEIRMAYGLNIVPPWPDGGSVFVNLPEHLEYMPGTRGIARHHDKRPNVWHVSMDSAESNYSVESLTEPGVFLSVIAKADHQRAMFEFSITNRSKDTLHSIRPLLCYQYNTLHGFPVRLSDNFAHTFILINGKPVAVSGLPVKNPDALARMAQVKDCADKHNWWAEKMGGFIEQPIDAAFTILTAAHDDRKVIVHWTPGKNLLSNTFIPCIHADPCIGNLAPGETRTVHGELIFTRDSLDRIISELGGI